MKKGFTLIELLAVIVILAVIALIAIPIVMDIIEDSRRSAAVASANGYVRAVNYKIAQDQLKDTIAADDDYVIGENALIVEGKNIDNITGSYTILGSKVLWAGLCVNGYSVEYNSTTGYSGISTNNYCNENTYVFVEPEAELMSAACTDSSKYTSESTFKIKTVEDLVCLSNLVNSGKNFSGKTVYLLSDLDITSDSSYKDKNTTTYGDINGNSTVEGLKEELTTGAGFKPIGNNTNKFSGTFDGYAFTISNLMINRTTSYTGLFGYNSGTIRGLKMRNSSIIGLSNVGSVVGYSDGTIRSLDATGTVKATSNNVGGIVGYNDSGATGVSLLFSGTVEGSNYAGGVVGTGWSLKAVAYDSTIKSSGSNIGKVSGFVTGDYRFKNVTLNYSGSISGTNGDQLNDLDLVGVDGFLDTIIAGDNDSDGYYFDYDSEGNITLYAAIKKPIETDKLKGEGTVDSPYLIRNAKDWKIASATVTQSKYYSITSDIDFGNKRFYALGTNSNKFNGRINGGMHTLKNIKFSGFNYVGVFGYSTGVIEGIKLENVDVDGTSGYIAALVGYNTGTIKGISGRNTTVNTIGNSVGGIVGYSTGTIRSINNKGIIKSTGSNVGGIVGYNDSGATGVSLLFSGTVEGSNYVGGVVGTGWSLKAVAYDSTVKAPNNYIGKVSGFVSGDYRFKNVTLDHTGDVSGTNGDQINDLDISGVDGFLDTYVGGDNDSDGYYFDYDNSGDIILYSVANTPIVNTLDGEGTSSSPYEIANANDWKIATSLVTKSKYFKVTGNIDFENSKFYPLGTNSNKFNGRMNGDMHTLKNIKVYGYSYVGISGNNTGTIEGIRFENVTIDGLNNYVGGVTGYNTGTIKGITGRNITVNSKGSSIGGIAGYSTGTLRSIESKGTVKTTGSNVGGIVGYNEPSATGASLAFSGTVEGNSYVGGVVGTGWSLTGFAYDSIVKAPNNSIGKVSGFITGTYRFKNVTLDYTGNISGTNGTEISEITKSAISPVLDTTESDNDGYYFGICNGSIVLLSTKYNPIGTDACIVNVPANDTPQNHLGIVYLNPKNISQSCNAQNSVSTTGTKEGCMKFYIYDDDGTNYKLLLDHNTSSNVAWATQADFIEAGGDLTEWQTNEGSTSRGPVTANKQLALDTTGWSGNPRLPSANEIAHITGADTSLSWNSSKTYASPVTDKSTQIGNYYFDGSGSNYSGWTSQVANSTNKSKYAWLFDNTTNCLQYGCKKEDNNEYSGSAVHGYWTSDASNINYPWAVVESGQLGRNDVTNASNVGIRPVITLSKTSVTVH